MDLIYSQDYFLLNQKLTERLEEFTNSQDDMHYFSLIDNPLPEIVNEILTPPMFASKKVVILKESWFLTNKKISLHQTFDLDNFLLILEKNLPSSIHLIFTVQTDTLAKTKKIEKLIKKLVNLKIEKPNLNICQSYVNSWIKASSIKFKQEAWDCFWNLMPLDLTYLNLEIQKLSNLNKSEITLKMVQDNCVSLLESDVFKLSEAFLKNEYSAFINRYQAYCQQNNELVPFLVLLGNSLTTLRNYLVLTKQGFNYRETLDFLKVNPYYLNNLLKTNHNTIAELNGKIVMIYELNKALIRGTIDKYIIPEYKFIKLFQKSERKDDNNGSK